jgi:hypothetical protein
MRQKRRIKKLANKIRKALRKNSPDLAEDPRFAPAKLIAAKLGLKKRSSLAKIQNAVDGNIFTNSFSYGIYRTPKRTLAALIVLGFGGAAFHQQLHKEYPDEMRQFDAGIAELYQASPADEAVAQVGEWVDAVEAQAPGAFEWAEKKAEQLKKQAGDFQFDLIDNEGGSSDFDRPNSDWDWND